jgi:hypothetical protein
MAETMQLDKQTASVPAQPDAHRRTPDHPAPQRVETVRLDLQTSQAIPAPAVHPSEGEGHVSPSEGITPTVVPSEGATPPPPDPPVPRHLAPDNVEPQPERR